MRLNRIFDRFDDEQRYAEEQRSGRHRQPHSAGVGLGYARSRDIEDRRSQAAAPRGQGRSYDRSGERRYEDELRRFENEGGAPQHFDHQDEDYGEAYRGPGAAKRGWELDEGGVQFGTRRQSFAGRGPRGYRRSDERIREDVCDLLTEAHDVDATELDVTVADAVVTLTGTVDDRAARRRAEDLALTVPGVLDVHNRLSTRGATDRGAVRLL